MGTRPMQAARLRWLVIWFRASSDVSHPRVFQNQTKWGLGRQSVAAYLTQVSDLRLSWPILMGPFLVRC
jgi:hypothetical protein